MSDLIFEDVINNLSNDDVNIRKEAINALVGVGKARNDKPQQLQKEKTR